MIWFLSFTEKGIVSLNQNAGPDAALYAMTPADHLKYHQLFIQYDINQDGLLSEPEAVGILSKSGISTDQLNAIYTMADDDKDTRLNSKEFCVAFHIILCIT